MKKAINKVFGHVSYTEVIFSRKPKKPFVQTVIFCLNSKFKKLLAPSAHQL